MLQVWDADDLGADVLLGEVSERACAALLPLRLRVWSGGAGDGGASFCVVVRIERDLMILA